MPRKDALTEDELTKTSTITLDHYNRHADSFWEGTRDHDVTQNRAALLEYLPGRGPFRILDFGCGPGRDLRAFKDMGHEVIGLDGAERFVELARAYQRLRGLASGFPTTGTAEGFLRWYFRQCLAFSYPESAIAARFKGTVADIETEGRALQLQSTRVIIKRDGAANAMELITISNNGVNS